MRHAGCRAGLLALILVLSAGCSARFDSFAFLASDGTRVQLTQSRRTPRGQEARFAPSHGAAASPVYRLAKPLTVASQGQSFALSYTGDLSGCTLTVFSDRNKVLAHAALPRAGSTTLRFLVPLERGARIWGYQLASASDGGSFTLTGAGTQPFVHGFSIDGDELSVDGSVEVLSASPRSVTARIPEATRKEMGRGIWLASLVTREGFSGGRVVFEGPDGQSAAFAVASSAASVRLDFARGSMGFLPVVMRFTGALRSMDISQVAAEAPIPADPGTILGWDRSTWRSPDFELFSWTRFPRVLIMDIASYDAQDALLKRLAFFVEKSGHAGTVESHAALAGLHGYNAHDYRAEDLARFFTKAEKAAGGLSIEEKELARLLLENGVLRKADAGYAPGDGCILSISRESSPLLRELLLTHECFHGLFFTLPAFRGATETEWSSLSDVEREVWKTYLDSHAYNTSDHYLLVNEFQSYLMQQRREEVNGYQDITLARMRSMSPQAAKLAKELKNTIPTAFSRQFNALDQALQAAGGPPGGRAMLIAREKE
jgi:hypothetical protein